MSQLLSWNGRMNRWPYFITITSIQLTYLLINRNLDSSLSYISAILGLLAMYLLICAAIKRLHDIGWSGAWFFIILIPIVGIIFGWVILLKDGTHGSNDYGEDPLDEHV